MNSNAMSLKAKIKDYANRNKISSQVVLQNYMFERFLERLSRSEYRDNFIIKGGMLIASIVGLDTRATMDLDATIDNYPLNKDNIVRMINNICSINLNDEVFFNIVSISSIRKNDKYHGFSIRLDAVYYTIISNLSIDITAGDVITPRPYLYKFKGMFDDTQFYLLGYNIETVMAEKMETILSRGIFNTRPRDFYDLYILSNTKHYDYQVFLQALQATVKYRKSTFAFEKIDEIINQIGSDDRLKQIWKRYQNVYEYAKNINYEQIIEMLHRLMKQTPSIDS